MSRDACLFIYAVLGITLRVSYIRGSLPLISTGYFFKTSQILRSNQDRDPLMPLFPHCELTSWPTEPGPPLTTPVLCPWGILYSQSWGWLLIPNFLTDDWWFTKPPSLFIFIQRQHLAKLLRCKCDISDYSHAWNSAFTRSPPAGSSWGLTSAILSLLLLFVSSPT